ncbi:MAG: NAD(P)H-binding protein [Actinomycetota bacterium]
MRVAVLGASGVIGRTLVAELARTHDVIAVARRPGQATQGVEWISADLSDGRDAERALAGTDVAVHLVHSLGSANFENLDPTIALNVARAAENAGLSQIVYLGGLGDESPTLSKHLLSRLETAKALAQGKVPVTTLRAGMVVGAGSAAFETIVALVDRLPAMICPRWVSVPTQPIALHEVVSYLSGVIGLESAYGETYDIGGPEVMTYRSMIDRIARIRGKHPLIVEVPVLTPRLSSWWLHLVTPVKASVARPLIDGLRNPTVVRDERIRSLVPIPLTPFDEAVREALNAP